MHKEVMLKSKKLWVRAGLAVQRAGRSWSWGLAASLDLGLGGSTEGKGKEEPPRQSVLLGEPKPCWDKPSAQPTLPTGFYILPERRQALLPREHRPEGKEDGVAGACTSPVPPGKCWRPCWGFPVSPGLGQEACRGWQEAGRRAARHSCALESRVTLPAACLEHLRPEQRLLPRWMRPCSTHCPALWVRSKAMLGGFGPQHGCDAARCLSRGCPGHRLQPWSLC